MIHRLKTHSQYFQAVKNGSKTFEIRVYDRPFKVGDTLCLLEYDPETDRFTGGQINRKIGFILEPDPDNPVVGLRPGFCALSLLDI